MPRKVFHIYSHEDADGGIAAAIFGRYIINEYGKHGWNIEVTPVNHGSSPVEWELNEINWPCAILDFSIHPQLFSEKYLNKAKQFLRKNKINYDLPSCYWIDHHPTGSSLSFLNKDNVSEKLSHIKAKWDTNSISTPGMLRSYYSELGLSKELIEEYELFIDYAEIIDGALYTTPQDANDFSSPMVKLQALFSTSHPIIDKKSLYKLLVKNIIKSSNPNDLFSSDPLFESIIEYENNLSKIHLLVYEKVTIKRGKIAIANFMTSNDYAGFGRFIPYMLFPDIEYAIHILPKYNHQSLISCGVNPWNKPLNNVKHLGNYFAANFSGGGHSFAAGGKIHENDTSQLEELIKYLEE